MLAATIAALTAASIARFGKKRKWWLKAHRAINLGALVLALSGFGVAFFMVGSSQGPHFRVPHAILGGIAILFILSVPALGFLIFRTKGKEKVARLRRIHRIAGRVALLLMVSAVLAGFVLIGVLG